MKTVDRYRLYSKPVRTTDLKVHVFVGPPNSGKTKFVNIDTQITTLPDWKRSMERRIYGANQWSW